MNCSGIKGSKNNESNSITRGERKNTLPLKLNKPAPPYFDRYGKKMLYATFRKNKATQWYVFFNVYQKDGEMIFIIRYISNNHVTAQYL